MAFRKKAAAVLKYSPDILVVPECEHPDKLLFSPLTAKPSASLWVGNNPSKGLGIFSYNGYELSLLRCYDPSIKWAVPIAVRRGAEKFTLLAIWANNPAEPTMQYVGQVWKAVQYYNKILKSRNTVIAGDFNSNTIWDKPRRQGNHTAVVQLLEKKKIHSCYHAFHKQMQGLEQHPTLHLYRHQDKPYHLDYCFASADLMQRLSSVEVGTYNDWCSYSDHMPIIASFE